MLSLCFDMLFEYLVVFCRLGWTALHVAASRGDVDIVRCLLGSDRHQLEKNLSRPHSQHQHQLTEYQHIQQRQFYQSRHERGGCIDFEDREGRTALHTAADIGNTQVIQALISAHPQLNKRDIDGATPLILAATHGHQGSVEQLTKAGCELDERTCEGRTALMEAVIGSQASIIKHLIQTGCHVNVMDNHGYSALSDAVCSGDMQCVHLLLEGGTDVDIQDSRGRTSLHLAIMYGYNDIAARLIEENSNIDLQDMDGYSAVFLAAWDPWDKGTLPTLERLARVGVDLNKSDFMGVAPLTKAWSRKDHVRSLIQHGCCVNLDTRPTLQTPYGFSLMELAAMEADLRTVYALRAAGFNPTVIDFTARREKYQHEYDELHKLCLEPLSLKDQCRLQIRNSLKQFLHKKIHLLPLPTIIKYYLCMEDL
jgi:ankyrin repeat protein